MIARAVFWTTFIAVCVFGLMFWWALFMLSWGYWFG
jgi:hypothetical protein